MTVVPWKVIRGFFPQAYLALLAIGFGTQISAQQKTTMQGASSQPQATFNRDIAPILYRSCALCHRPGESAPFSLLTYADAKSHAHQIAAGTKSRFTTLGLYFTDKPATLHPILLQLENDRLLNIPPARNISS
jgi:mono/diheme cytochrome c family protein